MSAQVVGLLLQAYGVMGMIVGVMLMFSKWRRVRDPKRRLRDRIDERVAAGYRVYTTKDRSWYHASSRRPGRGQLIVLEDGQSVPTPPRHYGHLDLVIDNEKKDV